MTGPTTLSIEALSRSAVGRTVDRYMALLLTFFLLASTSAASATGAGEEAELNSNELPLALVFSDDFSTDPNTNGQWTINRYAGDPTTEAAWDSTARAWDLTRASSVKGVAVFANYELTATNWKAEFRYRVSELGGLQGGGDGFVFMFYKDKGAYGRPGFGAKKGFELSDDTDVAGYGLQFDLYIEGCDPAATDYLALIRDNVCTFIASQEMDWAGDSTWHHVQVDFVEGQIKVRIDGVTVRTAKVPYPDYSFSGIGFGAGTGFAVGDFAIDSFRLWVSE